MKKGTIFGLSGDLGTLSWRVEGRFKQSLDGPATLQTHPGR